jgi:hypothetical protein
VVENRVPRRTHAFERSFIVSVLHQMKLHILISAPDSYLQVLKFKSGAYLDAAHNAVPFMTNRKPQVGHFPTFRKPRGFNSFARQHFKTVDGRNVNKSSQL